MKRLILLALVTMAITGCQTFNNYIYIAGDSNTPEINLHADKTIPVTASIPASLLP